jgi:molybdate transport system substrate-binding protein
MTTQPLQLMCALAVRGAFDGGIVADFKATGTPTAIEWAPTTVLMANIAAGKRADVIVLIKDSMDRLVEQGIVDPATRFEVAHSRLGLAVAKGAPHPVIDTVEAFTDALLSARSVAYSQAGASGIYFKTLIAQLGITDAINAKATIIPQGFTAEKLVTGEADLAVQQISELMMVPTIEIAGKFPEAVQQVTTLSAAILRDAANRPAAERFMASLKQPPAAAAMTASGIDPA